MLLGLFLAILLLLKNIEGQAIEGVGAPLIFMTLGGLFVFAGRLWWRIEDAVEADEDDASH